MEHILQAYADEGGDEEEEGEVQGQRRKRAPEAETQRQQQSRQRRRRPYTLPDAGELLDGSPRAARRHRTTAAVEVADARPTARPLPLPPPVPHQPQQQKQQLGPPLHDGNFPFLVYVPVPARGPLADALAALAAAAAPSVPGLQMLTGRAPAMEGAATTPAAAAPSAAAASPCAPDVPLHVSLTRAGTVRLRQAAPLVAALGRHLAKKDAAAALRRPSWLGRPRAFANDDRTRAFLTLTALGRPEPPRGPDPDPRARARPGGGAVPPPSCRPAGDSIAGNKRNNSSNNHNDDGDSGGDGQSRPRSTPGCSPALLRAITACDGALRELGLPPYYRDGQPHVSLASAPAESHAAMAAAAEGPVAEAVARMAAAAAVGRGAATGGAGGGTGRPERRAATSLAAEAPPPPSPLFLPAPRCVVCQIGKRRHIVWGSADD